MDLHPRLKSNLRKKKFIHPTEIQDKTIESLSEGRDVLGIANTGTGKTGAFLIPLINRLLSDHTFQTLVVVPTRELAEQVELEFKSLSKGLNLFSSCFIGGGSIGRDLHRLKLKNHVIVGTPGRLIDLMDRGALRLKPFEVLVLDEFDRMLDMGFIDDVKKLTAAMKNRQQTLLFSATVNPKLKPSIDQMLNDPLEVRISSGESTGDHIEQDIVKVPEGENKFDVLLDMLQREGFEKVLVFAETKRGVDRLNKRLRESGIRTDLIHGDKTQQMRKRALEKFRRGKIQVLVATDVASRGLDVSDVTHVINYETPQNFEDYVHRIGRTGRAGKKGWAFTFVQ